MIRIDPHIFRNHFCNIRLDQFHHLRRTVHPVRYQQDILAVPLIGIVPDDENVVIATNQGEPLVGSDTPAGKAYRNVVDRVLGKEIPFLDFEKGVSFWTKVTGIFRKA